MSKNGIYRMKNMGIKVWFTLVIAIVFLTDLAALLNIPYIKQIIGFLFLTLLPGLLILQILKLNKIGSTEKFVLSVGLSISFIMLFGLLINNLSLALGYETPLSTAPLLISFNIAFIILAIIGYKINKDPIFTLPNLNLSTSEKAFLIIPIFFPVLSIFGTRIMNTTDNNTVLMFVLFLIAAYVVSICFLNRKFPKRLYPVVIFLISTSLVLMFALRSNHIIGMDRHSEYYFFQTTLNNLYWSIIGRSTLDACLSISLLPAIYQSILNPSEEYLYKLLVPMMISISPLIAYLLSKKHIGELYAFLASFFFMSQYMFVFPGGRTMVAILFFALAVMTFFSDGINIPIKRLLFIIFMASCLVSHYSTTYAFFFLMLISFSASKMLSTRYNFKMLTTARLIILFFTMIFLWYGQVTGVPFTSGVHFVQNTLTSLQDMFIEESRSVTMQKLLGADPEHDHISFKIELGLTWITFLFIAIGVITTVKRYKEMIILPEIKISGQEVLKKRFEIEYLVIALVCSGLLAATVAVPHISKGYDLNRVYNMVVVILSLFFVIGGITLSKHLKIRAYVIILMILIPYFLFVLGPMHNILGNPRAITLNSDGKFYNMYYVHDQDSYGAKWVGKHHEKDLGIFADVQGRLRLKSQTNPADAIKSRPLIIGRGFKGYIYLWYRNVMRGELIDKKGVTYNMTDYSDTFIERNRIYDNGGSEVWR